MILTAIRRLIKAWKQYGLVATLRLISYRLKSDLVGRNTHLGGIAAEMYNELLRKHQSGEIQGIAIIPSAFEFDELYNQRTINLAKYLSGKGYGVIYVAWQWHRGEVLQKNYQYVYKNVIQVPLYSFSETYFQLKIFSEINNKKYLIMLPAKIFYDLLFFMKEHCFDVYYDIMDDWECFHKAGQAPWYNKSIEEAIVLNANRITAVSTSLVRKFSHLRTDIGCVGNGFCSELLGAPKIALADIREDAGINIGYFGHLTDAWFDWQLLFELLEKHKNVHLNIIGYGEPNEVRKKAQKYDNLNLVGKISPRELREYADHWHVAIIPFKKLELSEAVDPIKIYEYLYLDLPVVATGIPHLKDYPYVEVVDNNSELLYNSIVKQYEKKLGNEVDYSVISSFLSDKTWDKRFGELFETDFLSALYKEEV
ncbi:MAG: glycosyltransferase [Defluviitaleaceae bacterium]|nr:glycosyltransferase [Defluviitaleaceae bacterium]